MKNTLAENMLRFGVKNLKESDIKKIQESLLTEVYKDEYNITWPNFSNQQAYDGFQRTLEKAGTMNTALPAGQILFKGTGTSVDARITQRYLGDSTSFLWTYWNSMALDPNFRGVRVATSFKEAANFIIKPGLTKTIQMAQAHRGGYSPWDITPILDDTNVIEWWDSPNFEYPIGQNPKQYTTKWKVFYDAYIRPYNVEMGKWITKSTTPAAAKPGMAPGTKPTMKS